ncbi:MAG TPA: ATP-binding cassette domain-containing protein, partial [Reyranella sp.]|nr:ATP-binding cassette domain-containing protein [Reyranella sp.]
MALLDVENFSCGYGEMVAVRDLSFTIEPGQILALLGPNGAGKTSTMLAIMGHVQIKAGSLQVDGTDITRLPALRRAGLGLGLVPEGRRLFSDLSVAENLVVGGYSHSRAD